MPGTAVPGANLVDSLLDVVDDLRDGLHTSMGVRHWRVFVQRRAWDGGEVGEGVLTTTETEITPQPLVTTDLRNELTPAGIREAGSVMLSEVSLTYTEAELTGNPAVNEEWVYVLREAHGQLMEDRFYSLAAPPMPDRIETIGWILKLRPALVEDC
jgi:hypothetical protein